MTNAHYELSVITAAAKLQVILHLLLLLLVHWDVFSVDESHVIFISIIFFVSHLTTIITSLLYIQIKKRWWPQEHDTHSQKPMYSLYTHNPQYILFLGLFS